jgi:hypothetical protein
MENNEKIAKFEPVGKLNEALKSKSLFSKILFLHLQIFTSSKFQNTFPA